MPDFVNLSICFVSSYPPNRARLSEYANALIGELAKRPSIGKICVLADITSKAPQVCSDDKVEVRRVWKPDNALSILSIPTHIIRLSPDIVHFNCHYRSYGNSRIANFIGLCLPLLCSSLGKRSVVTFHNLAEKIDLAKTRLKIMFFDRLAIILATRLVATASCVTVTIRSYVEFIKRRYKCGRIVYVPHGTWMCNDYERDNPSEKIVLMFGHMSPYKGADILLKAFKEIVKEFPEAKLIIAGGDNPNYPGFLNELKSRTNVPNVKFAGYVNEEDVPKVFRKASLVILPYLTCIGTSGVFHLACSYGKPIIASDLPEIRVLLGEGASAIVVPSGDVEKLKEAILYVLNNPGLMKQMSLKNYAFARKFSFDKVAEAFERIYQELIR